MHGPGRKFEMRSAMVGGKLDRQPSLSERCCQSFGRKQVTSGPAGRKQHERRAARSHQTRLPATNRLGEIISARGCSRVNASNMPIAYASEIIDDPPYEINGNVMPFAGMRCKFTAILMVDCVAKRIVRPAAPKRANGSSLRMERISMRMTMNENIAT